MAGLVVVAARVVLRADVAASPTVAVVVGVVIGVVSGAPCASKDMHAASPAASPRADSIVGVEVWCRGEHLNRSLLLAPHAVSEGWCVVRKSSALSFQDVATPTAVVAVRQLPAATAERC